MTFVHVRDKPAHMMGRRKATRYLLDSAQTLDLIGPPLQPIVRILCYMHLLLYLIGNSIDNLTMGFQPVLRI